MKGSNGMTLILVGRILAALPLVVSAVTLTAAQDRDDRAAVQTLPAPPRNGTAELRLSEGVQLIGTAAPEWQGLRWVQGGPLTLRKLRGKVVLVRFWMVDCPYCRATAPALALLDQRYRSRGLVVVAIHHPITEASAEPDNVLRAARKLGLRGPVAHDAAWATLKAYGLRTVFTKFSSFSVLIDRQGIIRFVHEGGEYHPGGGAGHETCNASFSALDAKIQELLADRPRRARP
jgi:thiol-disulfide isomerase/thioredoxin